MDRRTMKKDIVLLDLFSGIGGFPLGLERAGFNITKHYFSEVDKHAIANYRYNFKTAEYVGSVTDVRGSQLPERPNIITFGSPCQDFSLAGKRKGMDGERSSLISHAIRLITECRPDVFIWENVKGTFSSNHGADFWAIVQAFANIGGYRLEWQLLNTAWLLPQNRERIYLIGHLGNGSGRSVFPFGEDDRLFARTVGADSRRTQAQYCSTIVRPGMGSKADDTFIATALNASSSKMVASDTYIQVKSATASGHECATIGDSINLSQPESTTRRGRVGKAKAQTLETSCNQAVVIGNIYPSKGENGNVYRTDGLSPTIKSGETSTKGNGGIGSSNSPKILCEQLVTSIVLPGRHVGQNGQREKPIGDPHFTIDAAHSTGICIQNSASIIDVSRKNEGVREYHEMCLTLNQRDYKEPRMVSQHARIRRLTEIECERLQGFDQSWRTGTEPANWTKFGINEKGETITISRTQRYKMLGNAVTANVVEMIGTRFIEL